MSIVKNEYDLTEKQNALYIACLRDSAIYENNGKISLIGKENLKDYINKLILERKFIEANELIKSARDVSAKDVNEPITAEISSKSFRIPFEPYSKLLIISSMNKESLSDSIKRVILPKLHNSLDELQNTPDININKLNLIKTILNDWSKRETVVKSSDIHLDVSQHRSEIDTLLEKYLIAIIRLQSLKFNLGKYIKDRFFEEFPTLVFVQDFHFCLAPNSGRLTCMLTVVFSDDFYDRSDFYYDDIFEKKNTPEIEDFMSFLESLGNFYIMPLGNYDISFDEERLFVNGIELHNKNIIKEMIFEELNKLDIDSYTTFLPRDFEVDIYAQKVQDTLLKDDYEGALELSEKLEAYEIVRNLSEKIYDILNRLVKESRVITINLPNTVLNLLDLTRGKESYREFISEAIENYWKTIESQEEIE